MEKLPPLVEPLVAPVAPARIACSAFITRSLRVGPAAVELLPTAAATAAIVPADFYL